MPRDGDSNAKRRRRERELEGCLERKDYDSALTIVEYLWPDVDGCLSRDRMAGLFRHWPEQVVEELRSRGRDVDAAPELIEVVSQHFLTLDDSSRAAVCQLQLSIAEELRVIDGAARQLAAGHDEEAMTLLREIGLRSPFRQNRLFLRGLSAFYRFEDAEALRAFRALDQAFGMWPVARALGLVCALELGEDVEVTLDELLAARPILEAWGGERAFDHIGYVLVSQAVRAGRPNGALRMGSRLGHALGSSSALVRALRYALPAVLIRAGLSTDEVCRRLGRAFPENSRGSEDDATRLRALSCELEKDISGAVEAWTRYLAEIGRRIDAGGEVVNDVFRALVCHRVGDLYALAAKADDDAEAQRRVFYGLKRHRPSQYWQVARGVYEEALAFNPERVETWLALLRVSEQLSDKRERIRVLERFIGQAPERPEALRAAAEAALERGAFDKGLRFARRAIELEPLSRDVRDLEVKLLRGKAVKKQAGDRQELSAKLFRELRDKAPATTRVVRREVLACAAVFAGIREDVDELRRVEELAQRSAIPTWSWVLAKTLARERYGVRERRAPRRRGAKSGDSWWPEVEPTTDELHELIAAVVSEVEAGLDPAFELMVGLQLALTLGWSRLEERRDFSLVLILAEPLRLPTEVCLSIAERGQELFPDSLEFTARRYWLALEAGKEARYFEQAVEELARVVVTAKIVMQEKARHMEPWQIASATEELENELDEIARLDEAIRALQKRAKGSRVGRRAGRRTGRRKAPAGQVKLFDDEDR